MKLLWTAMLADGRGSMNGTTFSRNRGGAYARTKTTPLNPQTTFQTTVRNYFGAVAQDWRALTQAQRDSWEQTTINFKRNDIFGFSRELSGSQLHQALNLNLKNISSPVITSPPVAGDIFAFDSMSLVANTTLGTLTTTFAPAITAAEKVELFATAPLSPGKNFVKNLFRKIKDMDVGDLSPFDMAGDYIVKFGALPAVGQKVFIKTRVVEIATGLSGIELTASSIAI